MTQAQWWIVVARERANTDLIVGPYPDEAAARFAMENAPLIEDLCQRDCIDCWIQVQPPADGQEHVLVDLADPQDTAVCGCTEGHTADCPVFMPTVELDAGDLTAQWYS